LAAVEHEEQMDMLQVGMAVHQLSAQSHHSVVVAAVGTMLVLVYQAVQVVAVE
jgi:hypothetical protein